MYEPESTDESGTHVLFIPGNIDVLSSFFHSKKIPEGLLALVGKMPSDEFECVLEQDCQEWTAEIFKRLLRRSSFLQAHQWTFCGLDLGNVGEAWEAINLIDNAFPRKHLIGSVSSHKDLIASFGRVWRTCDACDERSALAARPTSATQQTKDIFRTKQSDAEKEESSGATCGGGTAAGRFF